jgi:hypothetical protein
LPASLNTHFVVVLTTLSRRAPFGVSLALVRPDTALLGAIAAGASGSFCRSVVLRGSCLSSIALSKLL